MIVALIERLIRLWPLLIGVSLIGMLQSLAQGESSRQPNVVLIVCDNLGIGDIGCFGSTVHRTPNLDRMSAEGLKLTSFYVASGVCSPSRAALMTGCYPRRVGLHWTEPDGLVLRPVSPNGLAPTETTLAEVFKSKGYVTTCIGKWHLGDQAEFLPTRQGFDTFFGIPYSDDMTARDGQNWPPIPLMENEMVIEAPVDRNLLTQRYTNRAIQFMEKQGSTPFFLYLAHAMPGSTTAPFSSERFRNQSRNGSYGDCIEELDWSTGEVLKAIERLGIANDTLVIWTSDNGAQWRTPLQGSNHPWGGWGGWRYATAEGAMRVPAILWWKGKIPGGTSSDAVFASIDLMPSLCELIGAALPENSIDGKSIARLFQGDIHTNSPHDAIYFYSGKDLEAVRSGRWKLYVRPPRRIESMQAALPSVPYLVDLSTDMLEQKNVAEHHADVVQQLMQYAITAREDLGDGDAVGRFQRPAGQVTNAKPQLLQR